MSEIIEDIELEDEGLLDIGEAADDGQLYEHFRIEVDRGQVAVRIDKFLAEHQPHSSRNRIQRAADAGFIHVNGSPVKSNYKVRAGDIITLMLDRPHYDTTIEPEDIPLEVVYEDDDLMVINKPAGMVVHPGHGNYSGTLVNALAFYLGITQGPEGEDERLGVLVHRIDKDTSGLLVVAKTPQAQLHLADQFFGHSIDRIYTAVVWGNLKEDEGTIEGTIGRDPNDRLRFRVYDDPEKGKWAVTHWKVLERYGFVTVVECRLETGRTHQIRVHMSSIGHPLFNDERYGGSEIRQGTIYTKYKQFIQNCFRICPRQALHARTLGFTHPVSGERLHFEAPLPQDMQALIDKWRDYVK